MRMTLWVGALATMLGSALYAQDIGGDWQGTLKAGLQEIRLVVKIRKGANDGWNAMLLSIDQSPDWGAGTSVDSMTVQGTTFKFTVAALRGTICRLPWGRQANSGRHA